MAQQVSGHEAKRSKAWYDGRPNYSRVVAGRPGASAKKSFQGKAQKFKNDGKTWYTQWRRGVMRTYLSLR